jgi:hypothetical protein
MPINPPIVEVVPPGSTQAIVRELQPNTTYTAYIYHLGASPDRSFSTPLVFTFTTVAAQATAATPTNPAAFAGMIDADGMLHVNGTYGIEVTPAEFPSIIFLQVAIETAIGSGVPGGFVTEGVEPARVTSNTVINRTRIATTAANDNLKRFVQAYAWRRGAIQSATTTPIMVAPWGQPGGSAAFQIAGVLSDNVSESL